MPIQMDCVDYVAYLEKVSGKIKENKNYITELDAATGDGDHWANLNLGFDKLLEQKSALLAAPSLTDLFKQCGTFLMSGIGGSSGVLYGSAYLAAGKAVVGIFQMDIFVLRTFLKAELDAIMKRGNSQPGYKTMIDPLYEAYQCLNLALESGKSEREALEAMKEGAILGMQATAQMEAVRGRACYQPNKGVGHLDPGAVTMCYQLEILADCMLEKDKTK